MIKRNAFGSAAIAVVGLYALLPFPAAAVTGYDYGNANLNAETGVNRTAAAETSINQTTNQSAERIIEALRNHSGQQTLNTNAGERGASNREDVRDAREVTRRIEDAGQRAIDNVRGGAASCNVITGLMGGSALFAQTAQWREDITAAGLDYLTGGSNSTASYRGEAPGREQRFAAVCGRFATQDMIDNGTCAAGATLDTRPTAGGPPRTSSALDATIFLNRSVMSATEQEAAKLFMATAFSATPMGGLPNGSALTEQGRALISQRQAATARQSVAQSIMGAIQAERVPYTSATTPNVSSTGAAGGSTGGTSLTDFMEGTARRMIGYNSNGGNFPDGVSRHAWNEVRARSFYLDPMFQERIGRQDANQNSKDIAAMMSFQTYLQWEMYLQAERSNAALSMILGILEESGRREAMIRR